MYKTGGLALIFMLFWSCSSNQQLGKSKIEMMQDAMTKKELREYHVNVRNPSDYCIGLYNQYMTLIDTSTSQVSEESIKAFEQLFLSNARVYNDVSPSPEMIHVSDYTTNILYLLPHGLDATITKFKYAGMGVGDYEFYKDLGDNSSVLEWVIEKTLRNGYDTDNKAIELEEAKIFNLKLTLVVPENEQKAYIMKIVPYEKNN